jgi:hypothetical protein
MWSGSGSRGTAANRVHPITVFLVVGCSPNRVLLAPLVAAFNAHLGAVSDDIRWRLHVTAWGHLPARLCGVEHDCLVADGVLGGDAARLLKRASDEVAMFALPPAQLMATGQHAWVALVSLATNLRLTVPSLPPP